MLSPAETAQVVQIISNIDQKQKKVPYFSDLQNHTIYGQFFEDMDNDQRAEIREIITWYIKNKIQDGKTKGAEFFRRFYNLNQDNFWLFRELNEKEESIKDSDFQEIWSELKQELFKFENMLTRNMTKRWYGLDKVVSAYYDIVHSFFPWFSFVD